MENNKKFSPKDARKFIQNELIPKLENKLKEAKEKGLKLNEAFKTDGP